MASEGAWASPFFWLALSGFLFGIAVGRILRPFKSEGNKARYKSRGVTLFFFFLGMAAVAALCGVFIPGPEKFLDVRLAYLFGAVAFFSFLGRRFPGICGIPFIVVALSLSAFLGLLLAGWVPVRLGLELLSYKVLAYQDGAAKLELRAIGLDPREPAFVVSHGDRLEARYSVLSFSEYFSALGIRRFARLESLGSAQGGIDLALPQSLFDQMLGRDWSIPFEPIVERRLESIISPVFINSESVFFGMDVTGAAITIK
jgi:hypothetical protein